MLLKFTLVLVYLVFQLNCFVSPIRIFQLSNFLHSNHSNMNSTAYSNLLKSLYKINVYNPVKMGLENTQQLYNYIGRPLDKMYIVHVAGTNGKGSVSLKTAECLKRSGLKTGLFVSPHISSFRERVQINGNPLNEEDVITLLPEVFELCKKKNIPATFFEITTIMSFLQFQRHQCDAVVLEVGLGGRLDATNVVTKPTLSIITSIQLDHMKILGDTIEKIAMEKAGIMKPGVDVLVGPGCPINLLRDEAKRVGSPFYTLNDILSDDELLYKNNGAGTTADIDNLNTDISRAALKLLRNKSNKLSDALNQNKIYIDEGLSIRPPCRFELFKCDDIDVILDIAHNEDAIVALINKVKFKYPGKRIKIVLGMSADKTVDKCVKNLLIDLNNMTPDQIYCTNAKHPRAIIHTELRNIINESYLSLTNITSGNDFVNNDHDSVRICLRNAIDAARQEKNCVVVVCGTAFIMAEARAELGIVEPKDGDILYNISSDGSEDKILADSQEYFKVN